jgi:hypothetical protein
MKVKQRPNTAKKVNTGSTNLTHSNCYTALLDVECEDQQHKTSPENMPKHPPIYLTGVKTLIIYTAVRTNSKIKKIKLSQIIRLNFSPKFLNAMRQM